MTETTAMSVGPHRVQRPGGQHSAQVRQQIDRVLAEFIRKRQRRRWTVILGRIVIVAAIGIAWQLDNGRTFLGTPQGVAKVLWQWAFDAQAWANLWITLSRALQGFVIGTTIGVALGWICGAFPLALQYFSPFIMGATAIPKVALAPVLIFVFGLGSPSKIILASMVSFFLVFWNVVAGFSSIDRQLIDNAKVLGANWRWIVRDIYLPATLGWLIISLRLAATWTLLAVFLSEFLGSYVGLGTMLSRAFARIDSDGVLAVMFIIGFVGFALDRLLFNFERMATRWRM